MEFLFGKSVNDFILMLLAILIFIIILIVIIFILIKVFKINLRIKGIGVSSTKYDTPLINNFIDKINLVAYQFIDELQEKIKEKYILENILERQQQLNYCERIWKVVFFQIKNGFMVLKNDPEIIMDNNVALFDLTLESTNHMIIHCLHDLFQTNGINKLSLSELMEYIKNNQFNLIEIILKHIEKKCLFLQTPTCSKLISYIQDNFTEEIYKAIENSILKAKDISVQIKEEITQKDIEIKELLSNSIKNTLKEKIGSIEKKD